jgi:hypothetical protein
MTSEKLEVVNLSNGEYSGHRLTVDRDSQKEVVKKILLLLLNQGEINKKNNFVPQKAIFIGNNKYLKN